MRKLILSLALAVETAAAAVAWTSPRNPAERSTTSAETALRPEAVDRFVSDFDKNIGNDPVAADVIAHDPVFRGRVLDATAKAFAKGGWPAAQNALDAIMLEKQATITRAKLLADDALVVALWSRYLASLRALQDRPAACRFYQTIGRASAEEFAAARDEVQSASRAARTAYFSGVRNLAAGMAPKRPPDDTFAALLEKSTAIGQPLTAAEWAALKKDRHADAPDALLCAASVKFYENILALPENEAAALIRGYWGAWLTELAPPT